MNFTLRALKVFCHRMKIKLWDGYVASVPVSNELSRISLPFIDKSWKSLSIMFIIFWQLGHKLQNIFYESEALHNYHYE